eukprot:1472635-Prymnesium_polylepis.1
MWAVEARMQQRSSDDLACFDVRRDDWTARQNPQVYFDDVETGVHCASTDWYAGSSPTDNHGNVQAEAAALLGFDGDIERYCWDVAGHVNAECDRANMHILQLMEGDIKWNICRNFEWQVKCFPLRQCVGEFTNQYVNDCSSCGTCGRCVPPRDCYRASREHARFASHSSPAICGSAAMANR